MFSLTWRLWLTTWGAPLTRTTGAALPPLTTSVSRVLVDPGRSLTL